MGKLLPIEETIGTGYYSFKKVRRVGEIVSKQSAVSTYLSIIAHIVAILLSHVSRSILWRLRKVGTLFLSVIVLSILVHLHYFSFQFRELLTLLFLKILSLCSTFLPILVDIIQQILYSNHCPCQWYFLSLPNPTIPCHLFFVFCFLSVVRCLVVLNKSESCGLRISFRSIHLVLFLFLLFFL